MSIEELNELDLVAIEAEFGCHISEEIAQSRDEQALYELRALIDYRLRELSEVDRLATGMVS